MYENEREVENWSRKITVIFQYQIRARATRVKIVKLISRAIKKFTLLIARASFILIVASSSARPKTRPDRETKKKSF